MGVLRNESTCCRIIIPRSEVNEAGLGIIVLSAESERVGIPWVAGQLIAVVIVGVGCNSARLSVGGYLAYKPSVAVIIIAYSRCTVNNYLGSVTGVVIGVMA